MAIIDQIDRMTEHGNVIGAAAGVAIIHLALADRLPLAQELCAAALGLRPAPDLPELPLPDHAPWARLRACVSDVEHLAWAQMAAAAIEARDQRTAARLQDLVERRCCH